MSKLKKLIKWFKSFGNDPLIGKGMKTETQKIERRYNKQRSKAKP